MNSVHIKLFQLSKAFRLSQVFLLLTVPIKSNWLEQITIDFIDRTM